MGRGNLNVLPNELMLNILSYLSPDDRLQTRGVSHDLRSLSDDWSMTNRPIQRLRQRGRVLRHIRDAVRDDPQMGQLNEAERLALDAENLGLAEGLPSDVLARARFKHGVISGNTTGDIDNAIQQNDRELAGALRQRQLGVNRGDPGAADVAQQADAAAEAADAQTTAFGPGVGEVGEVLEEVLGLTPQEAGSVAGLIDEAPIALEALLPDVALLAL